MGIFKQISEHVLGWQTYLATDAGRLQAWPYLWRAVQVLVFLVVLLLILYHIRAHQVRRQRSIKYRISKLIAHLCEMYDCLENIDLQNQKVYSYEFRNGDLQIVPRELNKMQELVGPLHPEDAARYSDEVLKSLIERAMKTCSQVEFIIRERQEDGTYHWVSCLFQGIKKDKAHSRSCLLLKHRVNEQSSQEQDEERK